MSESDHPASADPLVGTILGRHRLTRLLGEGGMGAVYEGTHQELGRRAAVKTLHERYARSADVRQRFLREGQAASQIRHPNIVHVYDVGAQGDIPYLVMEFLEGEDLSRMVEREGRLSVERAADLLLPVVAAVAAAHDLGVVHRDLKPENIFLSSERGTIKPKVLDFGISKLTNPGEVEALTGTGAFLGTPHYMSPEQAQGAKHLDHRSDQFSIGVILYQCVTGRRPIDEPSLYALIQRIVRGEFPPPRQLDATLPAAFEALILRAMARDPAERFPSTRAFGRALLPFASERVQALHHDDLLVDPHSATEAGVVAGRAQPGAVNRPGLGTTLGESVHHRDMPGAPRSSRRWLGLAAIAALVAVVAIALRWTSSDPSVATRPGSTAEPGGVAEAREAVAPASTAASAAEAEPALSETPPAAHASASAAGSALAKKAPEATRPPGAKPRSPRPKPSEGRPSLAPR